jgi:hypothetical protein
VLHLLQSCSSSQGLLGAWAPDPCCGHRLIQKLKLATSAAIQQSILL